MGEPKVINLPQDLSDWKMSELEMEESLFDDSSIKENYWSAEATIQIINGSSNNINSTVEGNGTTSSGVGRDEDLAKVELAVLSIIFILTVLGNFVVLLGIFFRRQKMSRMYYFILHLSVADLITAFFNVLTQLFWEITYRFQGGNFLCKFVKYTQILGPYSSSYVLVMTALDRYQAICYPLSNCTWTAKRSKIMLAIAWAISLFSCLPQVFIFSYQLVKPATETEPAEYDCWGTFSENGAKIYVTWYSITVFIIPLIILVFAYGCITRAIWINFNMKAAGRNHDNYEKRIARKESDEDNPSQYEHSMDESRNSLENGASPSILRKNTKNKLSIKFYNSSKKYFSKKSSTSSTNSDHGGGFGGNRLSINRNVNGSIICNTKEQNGSLNLNNEEQNSLIPKVIDENELLSTNNCPSLDKYDLEDEEKQQRRNANSNTNASNGNPNPNNKKLLTTRGSDTCQHGRFRNRCNFCHLSQSADSRRHSSDEHEPPHHHHNAVEKRDNDNLSKGRSFRFATSRSHLLLPNKTRSAGDGVGVNVSVNINGSNHNHRQNSKPTTTKMMATYVNHQPRTHSVKGISRAKIKTIKLTVTIICCYIFCSSPFIAAQLWSVYDPNAYNSTFFTGPTFTILTLLASLNSCVNPYIFLFFNPNLLENFFRGIFRPKFPTRRFNASASAFSSTLSQNRKNHLGLSLSRGGGTSTSAATSNGVKYSYNV